MIPPPLCYRYLYTSDTASWYSVPSFHLRQASNGCAGHICRAGACAWCLSPQEIDLMMTPNFQTSTQVHNNRNTYRNTDTLWLQRLTNYKSIYTHATMTLNQIPFLLVPAQNKCCRRLQQLKVEVVPRYCLRTDKKSGQRSEQKSEQTTCGIGAGKRTCAPYCARSRSSESCWARCKQHSITIW